MPRPHEEWLPFARVFGCEAFAAHESALFSDQGFEFTTVASIEAPFASGVAAFELALAFAVLSQLARGGGGELRSREARGRFNEGQGKQGQAWGGVEDEEDGTEGDQDADAEGERALAVCAVSFAVRDENRGGKGGGETRADVRFSVSRCLK